MMTAFTLPRLARPSLGRLALFAAAAALVVSATYVVGRYQEIQARASDRLVTIGASYAQIPDLPALTRGADLVVRGRVLDQGQVRFEAQPDQKPGKFVPPPASDKPRKPTGEDPAAKETGQTLGGLPGNPVTDYAIQVSKVIKGDAPKGDKLVVSQPGGHVELPTYPGGPTLKRTLQFEDDPLMEHGQEHVFFLKKAEDGAYFVVGGPQGRFQVNNGKIKSVDGRSAVGKQHDGEDADSFAAKVAAVK
jgi:hypothetical protein